MSHPASASIDEIRSRLARIRTEASQRHGHLRQIVVAAERAVDRLSIESENELSESLDRLAKHERREQKRIAALAGEAVSSATAVANRHSGTLAPGPAGAPWSDDRWQTGWPSPTPFPGWVRLGSLGPRPQSPDAAPLEVPLLAPLLDTAGWWVEGEAGQVGRTVVATLARLAAALPLGSLHVASFSPDLSLPIGPLTPLREAAPRALEPSMTTSRALEQCLDQLFDDAIRTTEALSAAGADTVADLWRRTGSLDVAYHVLVLSGFPEGLTDATFGSLLRLAAMGARCGIQLIVHADPSRVAPKGTDPRELASLLTTVRLGASTATIHLGQEVSGAPDSPPTVTAVREAAEQIAANASHNLPVVPFAQLVTQPEHRWIDHGDVGISATIGRTGDRPLVVNLSSENPPQPNALIGGAVGQGKSNLLLVLIHALAAKYSPDDLQMILLDYKHGLEFSSLGQTTPGGPWLPHIQALGLQSDVAFGAAVLRHLVEEMDRRGKSFTRARASSITAYRALSGRVLPRLLLVVDEFHNLFSGSETITDAIVRDLEKIAREGRAFGIHVVLASQTVSGVRPLAAKGGAIFAQFHTRISLQNTRDESRAILAPDNPAAAELTYRGQAVVNDELGRPTGNVIGTVAYANQAEFAALRRQLWERAETATPPQIIHGGACAAWDEDARQRLHDRHDDAEPGVHHVWFGREVSIENAPTTGTLRRAADQTIAVVGHDEAAALAVLSSVLVSLAASSASPPQVVVLDGSATSADDSLLADTIDEVSSAGLEVAVKTRDEIVDYLENDLRTALDARDAAQDTVILALGVERARGLYDAEVSPFVAPADLLRSAAVSGSVHGMFLIGWWANRADLDKQLGYGAQGVGTYVLAGASTEDARTLAGNDVLPSSDDFRIIVHRVTARRREDRTTIATHFDAVVQGLLTRPTPEV